MSDLETIQQRGLKLFNRLLESESKGNRVIGGETQKAFSWFEPKHAEAASMFAFRLSALAGSGQNELEGLERALEAAEHEALVGDKVMVRQALSMFVTHNVSGRKLIKPRTVVGAPGLFLRSPKRLPRRGRFRVSEGGLSPELDYWREDELANEHHEHWHQVYPNSGIPISDFRQWVDDTPIETQAAILNALVPDPSWQQQLEAASPDQVARLFANQVVPAIGSLPPELGALIVQSNDRHGELFVYMHAQMLARYDAELLSHGFNRVEPYGPEEWSMPIPSGHNPIGLGFGRRRMSMVMSDVAQDRLEALNAPAEQAILSGKVQMSDGTEQDLDPVTVGEMLEAAPPWTTAIDTTAYRGLHNSGHGALAGLADAPGGVMASTVVAIRDPIFWRWHKHIDNLAAAWQDSQPPHALDDGPEVIIRNMPDAAGANPAPWLSPDIVLVNSDALPDGDDPEALGEALLGGNNWDLAAGAANGAGAEAITNELTTKMVNRAAPNESVEFLSHTPFGYYLRVENPDADDKEITVRIFIAPASIADDRRGWIEMDKFHVTIPGGTKRVLYRADTESSVIKRPAERSPDEVATPSASAGESSYCDCGWPWTLLLPRGDVAGMEFKMIVLCTDWQIDRLDEPGHCGSMSFCGAVDKYPDTREMGYPFNRPFTKSIEQTFAALPASAGRSFTIRHIE